MRILSVPPSDEVANSNSNYLGVQCILQALVGALTSSLEAQIIHVNSRTVEAVREQALQLLSSRGSDLGRWLTKANILSALFQLARSEYKTR